MKGRGTVGIFFALIGILLLCAHAWLDNFDLMRCAVTGQILLHLIRDIGIGFVVLGIFNFILSRADWQEYFEDRLQKIVVEQGYLSRLGRPELKRLMHAAIKAQAPEMVVDRQGGFLQYFEDYLHGFIFVPYREKATAEIYYADDPGDDALFTVEENFNYFTQSVGGERQKTAGVELQPGESVDGGSIDIALRRLASGSEIQTLLENVALEKTPRGSYRASVNIPPECIEDGLEVMVKARYKIRKDRIQTWWMLNPTRDLTVILIYPPRYKLEVKEFVQASELASRSSRPGYVMFRYPSWILPGNGIAWGFFEINMSAAPVITNTGAHGAAQN